MNGTPKRPRIHVAADDPSLTPHAGLLHVGELVSRAGLVGLIDRRLSPLKERDRGLSPGAFLVSVAESLLAGGDCLSVLDALRRDEAGAAVRAVAAPPAPTTAGQYFRRFRLPDLWRLEEAVAEAGAALDAALGLAPGVVTLDCDSTHTEVYGRKKRGAGWNHEGRRTYQPLVVSWAERARPVAADLLPGNANPIARAPRLLRRAFRLIPEGATEVRLRADSGFYSAAVVRACRRRGVRFSISAPRTPAIWRALEGLPEQGFRPAKDMEGAEVAETTYEMQGVGEVRLIVRRVEVPADALPSVRGRRRRTIPKDQLRLALGGTLTRVFAYSFIVTDLEGDAVEIEWFHRQRAGAEELFKDAKLGVGMRRMPMGDHRANAAWMQACLLALALSSMLQQVAGLPSRPQGKRLRRELVRVPGRIVRTGRRVVLRLPAALPTAALFVGLYAALRALGPPG